MSTADDHTTIPVPEGYSFDTEQVHAGEQPELGFGSRITPVYLSAGFRFRDFQHAKARFAGADPGYVYSRINNPTNAAVERRIAALENGRSAILVGSGQAAVTVAVLGLVREGDHILSTPSIYEGTRALLRDNFERFGIEVEFLEDPNDAEEWRRRFRPNTKAVFGESIPNPKNDLIDFALIADVAHEHGVPFIVDNTVPTPYQLRPIDHGADIVVHSASKFLAGHGAAIGGVVVDAGRFDWSAQAERFPHLSAPIVGGDGSSYIDRFDRDAYVVYARSVIASRLGPSLSPFNAFLLGQGLETLSLRVAKHAHNAITIARWLESRPEVSSVDYSGLESSPSYALAERYLPKGQGSVFAFTLAGGQEAAETVINALQLFSLMTHIGDVRSLVLHPPTTTHSRLAPEERAAAGIHDGLVRISVGIEDVDDLIADLSQAFALLAGAGAGSGADGRNADGSPSGAADTADLADGSGWPSTPVVPSTGSAADEYASRPVLTVREAGVF
ncbi:MAG: O-acetylhomoserine aminocarboxypropyltransferase/cysteine synthase family protein [Mycetocola sp.]